MRYYQFNVGDYAAATRGLSLLEDLAYRRILDQYYVDESPPKPDIEEVAREIGMREQVKEVQYVLEKFFTQTDDGWIQDRVEKEIEAYQLDREKKSRAGKSSAEARRKKREAQDGKPGRSRDSTDEQQALTNVQQTFDGCSTDEQLNRNQEPLTKNHNPYKNIPGIKKDFDFSSWPGEPLPEQLVRDWVTVRKTKRSAITQTVINRFGKQFQEASKLGITVQMCMSEIIERGWQGFKLDWLLGLPDYARYKIGAGGRQSSKPSRSDEADEALKRHRRAEEISSL